MPDSELGQSGARPIRRRFWIAWYVVVLFVLFVIGCFVGVLVDLNPYTSGVVCSAGGVLAATILAASGRLS